MSYKTILQKDALDISCFGNPCASIPVNNTAMVDISFNGEHIRFENLNAKQAACILKLAEFYQLSQIRKSTI